MRWGLFCILILLFVAQSTRATKIDTNPRPSVLLATGNFVAQDSHTSVTLYDHSGAAIHRYVAGTVFRIATTPDERYLLIGSSRGQLILGDLQNGATVWSTSASETGIKYLCDVSFSGDGKSLVACDLHGQALVFDTATGKQVGGVRFASRTMDVLSASLSFDGSRGVLVDLGERIISFETASGKTQYTGLKGAWPIRFTADGRYFVCCSNNSGSSEQLRIVNAASPFEKVDLGEFTNIGHIRPTPDGMLNVTAIVREDRSNYYVEGFKCDPARGELNSIWKVREDRIAEKRTDFDADAMIGVSTTYRLVTTLVDLRAGTSLLTIDNSAGYRPSIVSTSYRPPAPTVGLLQIWPLILGGAAGTLGLVAVALLRQRRKQP